MASTVSHSPSTATAALPGDMSIITTGQSRNMFWLPTAITTPAADCYYLNPFANPNPAMWTLNEGRDTLPTARPAFASHLGYLTPDDAEPNFPPLPPGKFRAGSTWTRYMHFFASTPVASRFAKRLFIAQCGQHGAGSAAWLPGTDNYNRVVAAWNWFRAPGHGWNPTVIWIAHGESDTIAQAGYSVHRNNWMACINGWRALGINCPIVIDKNSHARALPVGGGAVPDAPDFNSLAANRAARLARLRAQDATENAQESMWDDAAGIYEGINSNLFHGRIDGIHDTDDIGDMIGYYRYVRTFELVGAGKIVV